MIKRLNFRLLIYISGLILLIESAFMLSCLPVSLLYGSRDMAGFALSVMVTGLSGGILYLLVRKKVRIASFGLRNIPLHFHRGHSKIYRCVV